MPHRLSVPPTTRLLAPTDHPPKSSAGDSFSPSRVITAFFANGCDAEPTSRLPPRISMYIACSSRSPWFSLKTSRPSTTSRVSGGGLTSSTTVRHGGIQTLSQADGTPAAQACVRSGAFGL